MGRHGPEGGRTVAGDAIPVAQQFQQLWGEHRKAILAALALLDPQQQALGIDRRAMAFRVPLAMAKRKSSA